MCTVGLAVHQVENCSHFCFLLFAVTFVLAASQILAYNKFISLAKRLWKLRNYSTLMQVISGLNNVAVQRLKHLQESVDPESKDVRPVRFHRHDRYTAMFMWLLVQTFTKLDAVFRPQNNYHNYRKLKWNKPTIPFLAVHLRDLTFINDANPTFLDEEKMVVNFEKMVLTHETISKLNIGDPSQFAVSDGRFVERLCIAYVSAALASCF